MRHRQTSQQQIEDLVLTVAERSPFPRDQAVLAATLAVAAAMLATAGGDLARVVDQSPPSAVTDVDDLGPIRAEFEAAFERDSGQQVMAIKIGEKDK